MRPFLRRGSYDHDVIGCLTSSVRVRAVSENYLHHDIVSNQTLLFQRIAAPGNRCSLRSIISRHCDHRSMEVSPLITTVRVAIMNMPKVMATSSRMTSN